MSVAGSNAKVSQFAYPVERPPSGLIELLRRSSISVVSDTEWVYISILLAAVYKSN